MVEILRNKNLATRFQILVEIAAQQPNIQQKHIAWKLSITPQAVSDYVRQLLDDGLLISGGRSRYRVSTEGVDWILKRLKEAQEYFGSVGEAISSIRVSAAIAGGDLNQGQAVGLVMREGVLLATDDASCGAKGVAISAAAGGEDVGVTGIQGIIGLEVGQVTIVEIPNIKKGGSRNVDLARLQRAVEGAGPIAAVGIEAVVALKRVNVTPDYVYGARESVIEAANSGLSPVIVCVDEEVPALLRRLEEAGIKYNLLDLRLP